MHTGGSSSHDPDSVDINSILDDDDDDDDGGGGDGG